MIPPLPEFFVSYGSYHNNKVNQIIHLICIPQILYSLIALLKHCSDEHKFSIFPFKVDYMFIFLCFVMLAYIKIDFKMGFLCTIAYLGSWFYATEVWHLAQKGGDIAVAGHFRFALIQHIVCWLAQFVGHGVFEKRKPALVDNILLTLVAPAFVFLEVMFYFGYKQEIYQSCQKQIDKNIAEFHASQKEGKKVT